MVTNDSSPVSEGLKILARLVARRQLEQQSAPSDFGTVPTFVTHNESLKDQQTTILDLCS